MSILGFRHWPLFLKLSVAFGAIMVALLLANQRMDVELSNVERQVEIDLGKQAAPGLETLSRLSYYVPLMRVHIYRYCFFTEPERRLKIDAELKKSRSEIVKALSDYAATTASNDDRAMLTDLGTKLEKYWWWVEETQKLIQTGADTPAVQKFQACMFRSGQPVESERR